MGHVKSVWSRRWSGNNSLPMNRSPSDKFFRNAHGRKTKHSPTSSSVQPALAKPLPEVTQPIDSGRWDFSSGNRITVIITAMPAGPNDRE